MIIGVDMDEVLVDLIVDVLRYHNEKYGTSHSKEDISTYDLQNIWNVTWEETVQRFLDFYDTDYFDRGEVIELAKEGVARLAEKHELHVITGRPDSVEEKTRKWLDTHFPGFFKSINFTNTWGDGKGKPRNKGEICRELGVEVLIDDHLNYASDAAKQGVKVLLMDAPWNRSAELPENVKRVLSWAEIPDIIESM